MSVRKHEVVVIYLENSQHVAGCHKGEHGCKNEAQKQQLLQPPEAFHGLEALGHHVEWSVHRPVFCLEILRHILVVLESFILIYTFIHGRVVIINELDIAGLVDDIVFSAGVNEEVSPSQHHLYVAFLPGPVAVHRNSHIIFAEPSCHRHILQINPVLQLVIKILR